MKNTFLISAFIILFLSIGCHVNCPPDKKIGSINMDPETLTYFPYTGDEKLIFANDAGEEFAFTTSGLVEEKTRISVYKQCTEVKFDGQSTYEYFEGENKYAVFFSEGQYVFGLDVSTTLLRPEEELFFDHMVIYVNSIGTIGQGEIVTKVRFSETVDESEFNINNPMTHLDSLDIAGTTYYDVLASEETDLRIIYYTKEQGLVGFHDGTELFHLERVE